MPVKSKNNPTRSCLLKKAENTRTIPQNLKLSVGSILLNCLPAFGGNLLFLTNSQIKNKLSIII